MKKVVLVLVALLIAAPAMAAVTISANQVGDTADFTLDYVADGADASTAYSLISGMAINVTVGLGTLDSVSAYKTDGESTNASPGYGIYPGSIVFDAGSNMTSSGDPVAPAADAGALGGLGTAGCTVEAGALFDADAIPSAEPISSGTICTFTIAGLVAGDSSVVALALEDLHRKGIVMRDGSAPSALVLDGTTVVIPSASAYPGDANGDDCANFDDFLILLGTYNKCSGDAGYNDAADFNDDDCTDFDDFLVLLGNYNTCL